jgi:hypothetical protein
MRVEGPPAHTVIAFSYLLIIIYALTLAPVCWIYAAEVWSLETRAWSCSVITHLAPGKPVKVTLVWQKRLMQSLEREPRGRRELASRRPLQLTRGCMTPLRRLRLFEIVGCDSCLCCNGSNLHSQSVQGGFSLSIEYLSPCTFRAAR